MICVCGNSMVVRLARKGENKGNYFWGCSKYPLCSKSKNYEIPDNRFDFANNDFIPIIQSLSYISDIEREGILDEIKVQMIDILRHFVQCNWGAHFNTMFEMLIKPYLSDPNTLDHFLKSEVIDELKGNVIFGKTGAKIYPELHYYLNNVNSDEIKNYLKHEFKNISFSSTCDLFKM